MTKQSKAINWNSLRKWIWLIGQILQFGISLSNPTGSLIILSANHQLMKPHLISLFSCLYAFIYIYYKFMKSISNVLANNDTLDLWMC